MWKHCIEKYEAKDKHPPTNIQRNLKIRETSRKVLNTQRQMETYRTYRKVQKTYNIARKNWKYTLIRPMIYIIR